jgi:hypothetical protein
MIASVHLSDFLLGNLEFAFFRICFLISMAGKKLDELFINAVAVLGGSGHRSPLFAPCKDRY